MKPMQAFLRGALGAAIACGVPAAPAAQSPADDYPNKPIRVLVTFSAGSQTDMLSRMVGQKLGDKWGVQVVIDNRPSGGGTIATQMAATALPDGYTLLAHSSGYAINPWLYTDFKVDILRDMQAVTTLASTPQVVVVSPTLGPKTLRELIAFAKQRGSEFIVAVPGIASSSHLVSEKLYYEAGIKPTNVWYKGTPECMTDTMTMRTQMSFLPLAPLIPFIRDGRLLGLAVSSKERSPVLPDVPSANEAGLPGFDYTSWFLFATTAATPKPIVNKLSAEVRAILGDAAIRERLATIGATPMPMTPEQAQAFVRAEKEALGKIVRTAGVKIE
ncbi:MAG TPA: tripartite tricarboxylate transporter substrate-binding protein [Burkholderiales bacterium]|nr:tripartite tricarboxylate transporter substrate-binding protein [Burkholderiales bacterium]